MPRIRFFQAYEKLRDGNFSKKNVGDFWGRSGVPPVVAPEGGLGFAKGKAERTSMFVRARALEGREGCFLIISGN